MDFHTIAAVGASVEGHTISVLLRSLLREN